VNAFGKSSDERDGKDTTFARRDPSAPGHPVSTSDLVAVVQNGSKLSLVKGALKSSGLAMNAPQASASMIVVDVTASRP
jgi:hypothetical protein